MAASIPVLLFAGRATCRSAARWGGRRPRARSRAEIVRYAAAQGWLADLDEGS